MSRPGTTTLFAPPTPPASPTPGATLKPDAHPKSWSLSTPRSLLTSAVPADEDPLSPAAPASTSESELRHNPGNEQHYTTLPEPRPYVSPSSSSNTLRTNSTLAFFDKFVHQAKAASENKRRSLLDELLLHQDDPLFRRVRRENEEDEEEAGNTDLGNEISADKDGDVDEDGNSVDMAEGKNSSTSRVRRVHGSSEDDEGIADSDSETRGQVQDALGTLLVGPSDRDPALCSNSPQSSPQPPPSSFRAPGQSPPRSRHHRTRRPSTSTSSTSVSSSSSARHSPTLSLPSLAPPLLTEGLDLMDDVLSVEREGDVARGERREHGPKGDALPRSNSPYSTLSRLPTRWISSLSSSLSRSGSTPPSSNQAKNKDRRRPTGATPSLESIFAASSSTPAPTSRGRPGTSKKRTATSLTPSTSFLDILDWDGGSGSGVATPVPGAHDQSHRDGGDNNNIDIIPHRHPGGRSTAHNNGASAQPAGKGHVYVQTPIQIPAPHNRSEWPSTSHGHSPAPASITHETPFGSHVFAPISGAPGFMDKRYDWDKGYSNGLMREMREDDGSVEQEVKGWESDVGRNVSANGNGSVKLKGRRESVVKRIKGKIEEKMGTKKVADKENEGASVTVVVSEGRLGLGEFMEKKSGSIELTSRKDATIPVLDVGLADTVRVPSFWLPNRVMLT